MRWCTKNDKYEVWSKSSKCWERTEKSNSRGASASNSFSISYSDNAERNWTRTNTALSRVLYENDDWAGHWVILITEISTYFKKHKGDGCKSWSGMPPLSRGQFWGKGSPPPSLLKSEQKQGEQIFFRQVKKLTIFSMIILAPNLCPAALLSDIVICGHSRVNLAN